jgi:hypothetical protein
MFVLQIVTEELNYVWRKEFVYTPTLAKVLYYGFWITNKKFLIKYIGLTLFISCKIIIINHLCCLNIHIKIKI